MKRLFLPALLALSLILPLAQASPARADKAWAIDASLSYMTKRVWRGQVTSNESVLQPWFNLSYQGFSLGLWANFDLTNGSGHEGKFSELDIKLQYVADLGFFRVPFGLIHYYYPPSETTTTELFAGIGVATMLNPTVVVYYDVDRIEGMYARLNLSHRVELLQGLGWRTDLDLLASLGWGSKDYNQGYWGVNKDGLSDLNFTVAAPIRWGDYFIVTPRLSYSTLLDKRVRDASDKDNNLYGGISLAFTL